MSTKRKSQNIPQRPVFASNVLTKRANLLAPALLFIAVFFLGVQAIADNQASQQMQLAEALESMESGRTWEAQGNMDEAAVHYLWALNSALASSDRSSNPNIEFCGEPLNVLARRILYIDQQLLKTPGKSKRSPESILGQIKQLYRQLEYLEPTNPTWIYLDACIASSAGNYVAAYPRLQKCISLSASDADLRGRAQKQLTHIRPGYDAQLKWQEAQWKAWQKYVESGAFFRSLCSGATSDYSSSSSSSSDSGPKPVPDYERRARQAEYYGDSAAASRFRGGGDTCKDNAKYW